MGCEHKSKCLYKYNAGKNPDRNKVMKINERWEELREESNANIQSEEGILKRQIRSIQTEGPVSYTHLDVYKRQISSRIREKFPSSCRKMARASRPFSASATSYSVFNISHKRPLLRALSSTTRIFLFAITATASTSLSRPAHRCGCLTPGNRNSQHAQYRNMYFPDIFISRCLSFPASAYIP